MRTPVRNPLDNVTARAVELSRDPAAPDRASGANRAPESAPPPNVYTTIGADGGTIHPFFWDLDDLDNPNAVFGQ